MGEIGGRSRQRSLRDRSCKYDPYLELDITIAYNYGTMANIKLREQAIKLRQQGYTYGQIKRELGLAKSTLSDWLRNLTLTNKQLQVLISSRQASRDIAVERFRETFRNKRLKRLKTIFDKQVEQLLPLSRRELLIAGLFLYWGEGDKKHGRISISNTDPRIVIFALHWMVHVLNIPLEKIRVNLHLYQDMDIQESIDFWSQILNIPTHQFLKPYIKKTNRSGLSYKSFGHGTCRLYAGSVALSEKVAMSIKAISDCYGAKSELFWYN